MDQFRRIVDGENINKDEDQQPSRSISAFNPPSIIRDHSAFSKPILPSSSSLLSPKPHQLVSHGHHHFNNNSYNDGSSPITPDPDPPARYRDCQRNHAASLGGHVTDGCGEFMPAGPDDQLKCAACGCHRSFHRKEIYSEPYRVPLLLPPSNSHNINNTLQLRSSPNPVRISGGGNTTDQSSSEERNTNQKNCYNYSYDERGQQLSSEGRKKRFRTKFSSEQKERMRVFAERVGWRVQKKDEGEMERFCGEVGVSRQVFKVWMHNNKHLVKSSKKDGMQFEGQSEKAEDEDEDDEQGGGGVGGLL